MSRGNAGFDLNILGDYFRGEYLKLAEHSPWPILTFNVMSKPGGPACNMGCTYCYYRHKSDALNLEDGQAMDDSLLERFIQGTRPANPIW